MISIKYKLLIRKINNQIAIFMSAVFIVTLAVSFFVAVKTVYRDFKFSAEEYFENNALEDLSLIGIFNTNDIKTLEEIDGIDKVEIKHRLQAKINDISAIIYSTENSNKINIPFIHEGKDVIESNEIAINKNFADANRLKLDDEVEIEINGEAKKYIIKALVSYPNYVFLFKDGASTASKNEDFAVIEMNKSNFEYIPYNSLYATYSQNIEKNDKLKIEDEIREKLKNRIFYFTDKEQSVNYVNYEQTLLQIDSFSYICPSILILMAILLLYIIQRRNVAVERKQIGIMKAIGLNDTTILYTYIKYSFLVSFCGVLLAFIATTILLPHIFKALGNIFDMPNFTYTIHKDLWIISTAIILFVCIISNLLAAISILKLNPAQSMRGEIPKGGRQILIEKISLWNKLSFNTRYSIKNSYRSKTRYLASLFGMFAAISITIFAQGFNNSFDYFLSKLYNKFAKYDIKVNIENTDWNNNLSFLSNENIKSYDKALIYQSKIYSKDETIEELYIPTLIYDDNFQSLDIPQNEESENSIMIPAYLADKLKVKENDIINIEIYTIGDIIKKEVKIGKLVDQQGMFFVYINKRFAENELSMVDTYNNVFITQNENSSYEEIKEILDDDNKVSYYSFRTDEYEANKTQLATIYLLVQILIFIAFLLGATSLYGVGVITLATRKYEFNLLKVMGYTTKEIMIASLKETITQIILAIPLGILAGYGILYLVKKPFSSKLFSFVPNIYESSYILAIGLLIVVVILVSIMSAHFINKLDMAEGLKDREE